MVAEKSVCSDISFLLNELPNEKLRVEEIELELIMSDVAIRYLGALIFFAKFHGYCLQGGYFLGKNKFKKQ